MSSPSLKDLPKVALDLKSELEGFNHGCMKKAATAEKNVLPSAEGTYVLYTLRVFIILLSINFNYVSLQQSFNVKERFVRIVIVMHVIIILQFRRATRATAF